MVTGGEGRVSVIWHKASGWFREGVVPERVAVGSWEVAKIGGKIISLYAILIAVNFSRKVQQENVIRVLVNMRGTVREKKKKTEKKQQQNKKRQDS